MKLYQLYVDFDGQYARLSPSHSLNEIEPEPKKFIWNNFGADDKKIADFVPAFFDIIVKEEVGDILLDKFKGIEKRSIKIIEKVTDIKKKKRLKWYPLEYPNLVLLKMTKRVTILPESTVKIQIEMENGIERKVFESDSIIGIAKLEDGKIIPRENGKGFYVDKNEIIGYDIFHPEDSGIWLCTNKVKTFCEKEKFTNVYFLEAGDIV
jgi:hypothetical protein